MNERNETILVVDNEQDLTGAISIALEHEGFTVHTANGGEDGLRIALETHPDLIFLDIEMPDMTGIEVLKNLRKDEWGKTAKVIVMTVVDDMEKIAEFVEHKGDAYVLKNKLNLSELVSLAKEKLTL